MSGREIKFRVWDKKNKKMCVVESIEFVDQIEGRPGIGIKTFSGKGYWIEMHDGILQQYTGQKDMFGQEIYEGDIYHQGDPNIKYVVVWNEDNFAGKQIACHGSYAGLYCWRKHIEIQGNIYENPELL